MYCVKCNHTLGECTCEDIEERLASPSQSPYLAFKWCKRCDKHYEFCKCENPLWVIKTGNKELDEGGENGG